MVVQRTSRGRKNAKSAPGESRGQQLAKKEMLRRMPHLLWPTLNPLHQTTRKPKRRLYPSPLPAHPKRSKKLAQNKKPKNTLPYRFPPKLTPPLVPQPTGPLPSQPNPSPISSLTHSPQPSTSPPPDSPLLHPNPNHSQDDIMVEEFIPETATLEAKMEEFTKNPEPEPPDLHSIDTTIMVEAMVQYEKTIIANGQRDAEMKNGQQDAKTANLDDICSAANESIEQQPLEEVAMQMED
ncbi:hypothetical protein PIB30_086920 [Stylosanthes scabra]|uniref:Uncharacterized protein n=1 Tax=Stylosanthes scabra TaxID=79078 RepID=A0ABU6YQZ1_9FABA|nr:hypothetical protein [Stylosanthes scabra]